MLFKDVIGHTKLKEKLIRDVATNQVAHAHLFTGSLGYGGLALSLAFVQYLLCENRGETDSCGECSSCKQTQKLTHPDFHLTFPTVQRLSKTSDPFLPPWREMMIKNPYSSLNDWINWSDKEGHKPIISVHQSVEIIRKLTLKSFRGGYKVSLIWLAEEMNIKCANKLLKVIEEPTNNTVFILLTENEEMILPTILSRTQMVRIPPLQEVEILDYLETITNKKEEEVLKSIAASSEGSLSVAIGLLGREEESNINFQQFVELMRVCYKKQVLSMLKWSEKMAKMGKEEQKQFLRYALYIIRQSMLHNYSKEVAVQSSEEEEQFLGNFARFITGNNVMEFNQLFNTSHYNVERNAYGKLLFTNIAFQVMRFIHKA